MEQFICVLLMRFDKMTVHLHHTTLLIMYIFLIRVIFHRAVEWPHDLMYTVQNQPSSDFPHKSKLFNKYANSLVLKWNINIINMDSYTFEPNFSVMRIIV